jgi:hypothetical protein
MHTTHSCTLYSIYQLPVLLYFRMKEFFWQNRNPLGVLLYIKRHKWVANNLCTNPELIFFGQQTLLLMLPATEGHCASSTSQRERTVS